MKIVEKNILLNIAYLLHTHTQNHTNKITRE